MMKKILISIVVVFVVFLALRDFIIKQAIESVGSSIVGAPIKVGSFSLSLLTSRVYMKDFKIYNPPGFTKNVLIDIANIEVHFNAGAIASGKLYFPLIDLNIRRLAIERDSSNLFNVASLKIKPQKSDKPLDMKIDVLKLNVDQVTMRDSQGKEINQGVGLRNKTFTDIRSPQKLIGVVLFEASGLSALKNMAMSVTKEVFSDVKDVAGSVKDVAGGVTGEAKKTVNSLFNSLKSAVK